jgi:hypothetical protein
MQCPRCGFQNRPDSEFCEYCNEVLLHNAFKGYQRLRQQEKRQQENTRKFFESRKAQARQAAIAAGKKALWRHSYWAFIGLGVVIIVFYCTYYQSPLTRLRLNGTHFRLLAPHDKPTPYLLGLESNADLWTEHDGRPDPPLQGIHLSETGTLMLTPAPSAESQKTARVRVTEWVRSLTQTGRHQLDNIPANHPSIAPGIVLLDPQGTALEYQPDDRTRIGRALASLFPHFPKGNQRPGSTWSDDVEWYENLGKWRVQFKGTAHWMVKGYETCQGGACVKLVYELTLEPTVIQRPEWVISSNGAAVMQEKLSGSGEAFYSPSQNALISNTLAYNGTLSVPCDRLEEIPWEERPSDSPLHGSGLIRIRLNDRLDIRKT